MLSHTPLPPLQTRSQIKRAMAIAISRREFVPPTTPIEIRRLAQQICTEHQDAIARLACLDFVELSFGKDPSMWPVALQSALFGMRQVPRSAWLERWGITESDVQAALASIRKAQMTIRYLDNLHC